MSLDIRLEFYFVWCNRHAIMNAQLPKQSIRRFLISRWKMIELLLLTDCQLTLCPACVRLRFWVSILCKFDEMCRYYLFINDNLSMIVQSFQDQPIQI